MTCIEGCLLVTKESEYISADKLMTILNLIRKGLGATKHLAL